MLRPLILTALLCSVLIGGGCSLAPSEPPAEHGAVQWSDVEMQPLTSARFAVELEIPDPNRTRYTGGGVVVARDYEMVLNDDKGNRTGFAENDGVTYFMPARGDGAPSDWFEYTLKGSEELLPLTYLGLVEEVETAQDKGTESVNGVECRRFVLTADVERFYSTVLLFGEPLPEDGPIERPNLQPAHVVVWIGEDDRQLHKLEADAIGRKAIIRFQEHGVPQSIDPPR